MADALSRKGQVNNVTTYLMPQELCWEMEQLNHGMLNNIESTVMEVESSLEQEICKGQESDEKMKEIKTQINLGKALDFTEDEEGTISAITWLTLPLLWFCGVLFCADPRAGVFRSFF